MGSEDILIILSPAFSDKDGNSWMPAQEQLVLTLNKNYPSLKVIILSFHFPLTKQPEYDWHGNKVYAFSGGLKGKLYSLLRWQKVWNALVRIKKGGHIIGLFSFFCGECAFIGKYFGKRFRIPHRIWILGQDARKENHHVRRIKPAAEELICISDFLQSTFEQNHHIRPAHVIPIGIDKSQFSSSQLTRTIDVIGAGSLIPLKQYDVFVRVVGRIAELLPEINAELCGGGPEKEALEAQIINAQLGNILRLRGQLGQQEVLHLMQQSKLFLHTSSYEGLGAACLEALCAGAHVISFCKPFEAQIPHWHIVRDEHEMTEMALTLLNEKTLDHTSILPFEINSISRQLMDQFNYRPMSVQ